MRVLLTNHFPLKGSGSGVYTMNIARTLARRGHEVCIVVPENEPLKNNDRDGIKIVPVYFDGCCDEALDFNFPCFTTHPRSKQTFYDLTDAQLLSYEKAFTQAFAQVIGEFKPDVIHCGHIWEMAAYAASFEIPLVITAHGTDLIGFEKSPRFRENAQKAFDAAKKVIAVSKDSADLVVKCFGHPEKVELIRNGYDPSVFYPEPTSVQDVLEHFGIARNYQQIVSFAGKFTYFKGIDVLLNAARIYESESVATVLAGEGELFDEMIQLAADLGLKHVYFTHDQTHEVLRHLYSCATCSLLPSRNEAFGLVAIEALACGTPVIASNEGGPLDIITPEVGLLFQTENPEDLARKVKEVLDGQVVFDHQVVARYALEHYSQEVSIDELIDVYQEAIR